MAVFDPLDYFKLAQSLLENAPNEAGHRSAISRAYYACFLTARDSIFGLDHHNLSNQARKKDYPGSSEHVIVILAVARHSNLSTGPAKRLSDQLAELKEMRERADYYRDADGVTVADVFKKHNAKDWNELANKAMALASNVLPEAAKLLRR